MTSCTAKGLGPGFRRNRRYGVSLLLEAMKVLQGEGLIGGRRRFVVRLLRAQDERGHPDPAQPTAVDGPTFEGMT